MTSRYCDKHDRPADDPVCSACVEEKQRALVEALVEIRDNVAFLNAESYRYALDLIQDALGEPKVTQ